ncbi:thiolase family protein [Parageobacillus thermoglucosidasius]|uniref:thiolase family protein n=1 Tax=Parageobacillus thermoglucosidasius TaxID=1426 RepID=UPI0001D17CFD|nr:thiolase family protein [Parageobacillus thermoglucosidasius]AEH48468.1 acetyl-CoA acetyltransferase [Parageobacillus thermoglucosidasius C56-YS93]MED4904214.1 thiolase family protein [Parageobacillus thermoglucosidasius]MED4914781.1 thiolase family protein [Parageobacillus thermoglucosidasius]MED4943605.1 thiolase family protein [Parageobacillus thermoglucosidasius]MED4982664.1 thiolase family protein [Parageobacillus thermoglucosidasius]
MREVVIVEAVRTPVGKRNGVFRNVHPVHLAAIVLDEVIKRAGIEKRLVEDIVMGCVTPIAEQGYNIGRLAALEAGFPIEVPAVQINRMCGSGQQAIHFAAQEIRSGDMDITIAAGVESMTKVPILSDGNDKTIPPSLQEKYEFVHQGVSAELIAKKYGLTREQLDAYAYESHQRAIRAQEQGIFDQEIVPVEGLDKEGNAIMVTKDEGPRRDTSPEALASLRPVFRENGKITAGNASQMSDGAAAVLLMEKETARELGVTPKAKIIAQTVVGSDPTYMLDGVIPATKKVLQKAGLTVDDIDLIEINEAFAPVVLAWQKEIGAPFSKVNVNGGAIALGHPLGATGAKLMTSLVNELKRRNGKYGLLTICIGHGMATATIIERL